MSTNQANNIGALENQWRSNPRWKGITRPYKAEDVIRLRGTVQVEHTLARLGAERLWDLLQEESYVAALGAMTGNQAIQQVEAGLQAIYVSGWQVAADANNSGQMYPDQSLYPADSVPNLVRKINQALMRADQIHHAEGKNGKYWFAPMVADAEAGFGGNLNAFELMKAMIEAGAACVHFEDQLSSAKKCGHLGGKVLVSTTEAIQKLVAARLAADVMGVPTSIRATGNSAPGSAPRKVSLKCEAALKRRLRADWRMRRMWICCGAKRRSRIWKRRGNLRKEFMRSIRGRCWRTTARLRSTGESISARKTSRVSSASLARWVTSSSSSRWPDSTR
jgi:hypothetical protein